MHTKQKLAALASAAMLLGTSTATFADHDYRTARNDRGQYDYARVISAEPIVNYVTVTTPVRECWQETQYYTVDRRRHGYGGNALFGAVIGGVIGHQVGSGRGNDAATIAGSLIGAAIGSNSARRRDRDRYGDNYGREHRSRPVERCATRHREHREKRIDGYRVTYRYNGQKYRTEMPYDPGKKIRVRVDIRPAG